MTRTQLPNVLEQEGCDSDSRRRRPCCDCNGLKKWQKMCCIINLMLLLWGCFILAVTTVFAQTDIQPLVINITGLGLLKGSITKSSWTEQTIYQFLSIPFAKSPRGELRFKPPVPITGWNGVKDATRHGYACPVITTLITLSEDELSKDLEDCLHLSIYTKSFKTRNPVMVYIHGGGFYNGSAASHPPNYILEKNVVLVVPQYRLGALGFLSTKTPEIPGNAAVLDIILSLEWINSNIEYFGGDSSKITVFGQSAGAALATLLTISPAVPEGLFHRVIFQSGSMLAAWAIKDNPIDQAVSIAKSARCSSVENMDDIHTCLINLPLLKLLNSSSINDGRAVSYAITVGDPNKVLPEMPSTLLKKSEKPYTIIGGTTKHDGTFALATFHDALVNNKELQKLVNGSSLDLLETIFRFYTEKDESGVLAHSYMKLLFTQDQLLKGYTAMLPGLIDLSNDILMKSPVLKFIQHYSKRSKENAFLYTFDYKGEYTSYGYGNSVDHYPFDGGIHHSDDNIYLFPTTNTLNSKDTMMAKIMVALWTSFAKSGTPKVKIGAPWIPFEGISGPYLHLNRVPYIGLDFLDEFLVTVNDKNNTLIRKRN